MVDSLQRGHGRVVKDQTATVRVYVPYKRRLNVQCKSVLPVCEPYVIQFIKDVLAIIFT